MILTADSCAASDCAGFVLVLMCVMVDLDITGGLLLGSLQSFAFTFWQASALTS